MQSNHEFIKDGYGSNYKTKIKKAFSFQDDILLLDNNRNTIKGDNKIAQFMDSCVYFKDGKTKVDYVLVYEETQSNKLANGCENDLKGSKKYKKQANYRDKFLKNLKKIGLLIEEELLSLDNNKNLQATKTAATAETAENAEAAENRATDEKATTFSSSCSVIHFIKLSTPWTLLVYYAEKLSLRAPLQARSEKNINWSESIFKFFRIYNPLLQEVPNKPLNYYTCAFKFSKIHKFLGGNNENEYFTKTQRIRVIYEILSSTVYGKSKKAQIGIGRLVEEGVFTGAFPLHDGSYRIKANVLSECLNKRQILYEYWAKWSKWYKYQPLEHIRDYFGERIAMYFAWLGFYTSWLIPAAIVGLLVFLYGVFTVSQDIPSNEICDSGKNFKMCKNCDEEGCPYWYLSEICFFAKLSYLFDQPGTVIYAIFVSFWAVTFLEYWKRKSANLAYLWDATYFEEEEERPKPEFAARAPTIKRNPITGLIEPSFPRILRYKRMAAGIVIIALMMSLVLIFIIAVIIYRVLISIPLFKSQSLQGYASTIASTSGAVVHLILIMFLGRLYEKLALRLTQWEMHRTQTEFDNHLALKVFIFQFFNFYSSIFYIAFFKGKFVGSPKKYSKIFGLRNEACSSSGCLVELAQQLTVIMIGKQIINNAQEILWPKLKSWWYRRPNANNTPWEHDYQLLPYNGLFEEYLEMVLQFGFITIFVAAFPLAPLFALLNNWVEIRLDAHKLVCETRRPIPERAQNIGIWFKILNFLAHLAVISNGFLIAFTSDFLPKMLYKYEYDFTLRNYVNYTLAWAPVGSTSEPCRYRDFRDEKGELTTFYWKLMFVRFAFVCIFEHIVFSVCRLIDAIVPDIPKSLELKIKRERYLAKQALTDSEDILKQAQSKIAFSNNTIHTSKSKLPSSSYKMQEKRSSSNLSFRNF